MSQIKLIKDFPFRQTFSINPAIGLSGCLKLNTTYSLEEFQQMTGLQNPLSVIKEFPEHFEIQKPQILKRSDGSVISGLEEVELEKTFVYIDEFLKVQTSFLYNILAYRYKLKNGLIFLPEDTEIAEKKAQMLSKKLEIQFEIDRLNAEEEWTVREDNHLKYIFDYIDYKNRVELSSYLTLSVYAIRSAMSEKTAEAIVAKFDQGELKQYLGIII